jgi:hypothetical protein
VAPTKAYCFSSKVPFLDTWADTERLTKNYNEWADYLPSIGLDHMLDELHELYQINRISFDSDYHKIQEVKEIDHLINALNKLINGDH